ncbi:hypothetical protein [Pseudorhodoferax sp. Leaf267]|uniref:hypothetical protein n=1 Tax=Pseudorhodoferax sp. Leaf267 TaxID=1736316 RepID=UPI000AE7012B|nr:hypothetical protein [Pseudorhodoferax sp. Leaf267]
MSPIHVPEPRLGLDIGRVLIAPCDNGSDDTSFIGGSLKDALSTPPHPGMFECVPVIVQRFERAVWLVSKAGPRVQERTRKWLDHHNFYQRTNIRRENVRFCLERRDKATHCAELGLTHFVDDREDVLRHMEGVVQHRYLFGPQDRTIIDKRLTRVSTWAEACSKVMPQVPRGARGTAR